MNECYGKKFILDGAILPRDSFDNKFVYEGDSVYEVIRMAKGSPVFFHDHMERLETSLNLMNKKSLASITTIRKDIIRLARTERRKEINLKIVFNYSNGRSHYLIYFIEPVYPDEKQYRLGVRGILYYAERKDPESKVINHKLRSSIFHKLILESGYEALLVNEDDCITEGSRSNIFFLKGDILVTAPDNRILNGITRKYILQICREIGQEVRFDCVRVKDIGSYDAVFMTGTSPVVLPFCCIGDIFFEARLPVIENLRHLYMIKAEESIRHFISNTDHQ
jgi:branched-chain amino acid aminotransferase